MTRGGPRSPPYAGSFFWETRVQDETCVEGGARGAQGTLGGGGTYKCQDVVLFRGASTQGSRARHCRGLLPASLKSRLTSSRRVSFDVHDPHIIAQLVVGTVRRLDVKVPPESPCVSNLPSRLSPPPTGPPESSRGREGRRAGRPR